MADFGATARRTTSQFTPSGGQPVSAEPVNAEAIKIGTLSFRPYAASTGATPVQNVQPTLQPVAPAIRPIAEQYDRPRSTLDMIFRILRVGENVGAGFVRGTKESVEDIIHARDAMDAISGAAMLASQGRGIIEMVKGVRDDLTFTELIEETANPESWLYKHRRPIGIALSFFGDPTTYLSFGATGASKVAAKRILSTAWAASHDDAIESLARGVISLGTTTGERIDTGIQIAKGMDYDTLVMRIHTEHAADILGQARPVSLGDALAQLKQADRTQGGLRGAFARGGQGIRFAGATVPGTVALGEKIGQGLGRASKGVLTKQELTKGASFLIPDAKLMEVMDDFRRYHAMEEFHRIGLASTQFGRRLADESAAMFEVPAEQLSVGEKFINAVFVGRRPNYVPREVRNDLLRKGYKPPKEWWSKSMDLRKKSYAVRDATIQAAKNEGLDDRAINDMHNLWDELVDQYSDPIEVLTRFQMKAAAKLHTISAIDQMLRNPMFARIDISRGADDLTAAFDEMNVLQGKLADAKKGVHNKKLSPQVRGKLAKKVEQLEPQYRAAQTTWKTLDQAAKETAKAAGPRKVAGEAAASRIFQQTAVPVSWRKDKFLVPQPIAEAIEEMKNPKFVDAEMKRALRRMNWVQSKWKVLATSVNPAFHVMNLVGGMWNNMLGGIYSPLDYVSTMADVYKVRSAERVAQGGSATLMGRMLGPPSEEAKEAIAEGIARNVQGGMVNEEILMQVGRFKAETKTVSGKRAAFTALRRTYGAAALSSAVVPDEWIPDEVEDMLYPTVGAAMFLPEAIRVGSKLASDVEEALRMTPFRTYAKDRSIRQVIAANSISPPSNFGKWMDDAGFKSNMEKEITWDIGAAMALKYQFDYSNLTHFERYVAKTIFPFYTFYKNNFVLQVQELVGRPRFVGAVETMAQASDALANYLEGGISDDENNEAYRKLLPEYFNKLGMFRVPVPDFIRDKLGLPADQPLYLNPKLPFASLNLFPAFWEIFNEGSVTPSTQRMMGILAPVFGAIGPAAAVPIPGIKPLLEYSVGYQLGLAKPIDYQRVQSGNWRNANTEAPGYMQYVPPFLQQMFGVFKDPDTGALKMNSSMRYIADNLATPFITGLGEPLGFVGDSSTAGKRAAGTLAWMSGIRLTPVDPVKLQRGWLYRMENFLEGKALEYKDRGITPPAEDVRLLAQIRAQLKGVEAAYDRRENELYGG